MCSTRSGEEMNDTFERSPSLDASIGTLGFNVMGKKVLLKAPGCSARSPLALLKVCFYQNSNSNNNNKRCLPSMQAWRPGNLRSGWHILAASFIAGNQEMLSRAGTDGMARRQASGLGASKVQSLELTKLTCPWKSLLDWHFLMENFCLCLLRNSTTFEQQAPSQPVWICHLTFCASWIGLQGKHRFLQWGSMLGSDMNLSPKGTWYPPLRPWKSTPEDWGSHSISWL